MPAGLAGTVHVQRADEAVPSDDRAVMDEALLSGASLRCAARTANVGGAIRSGWPSALAASGSRWTASWAPTASANSRIFSRPTSYTGDGG